MAGPVDVVRWLCHQFLHYSGSNNPSGSWYGFWSGFGSDIPIIGGVFVLIHHHNCHVKGCLRPGLHKVEGTPYVTCKTHHPTIDHQTRVTAQTVIDAHEGAQ